MCIGATVIIVDAMLKHRGPARSVDPGVGGARLAPGFSKAGCTHRIKLSISQLSLAIPIVILYEISIWMARMVEKKRAEQEAKVPCRKFPQLCDALGADRCQGAGGARGSQGSSQEAVSGETVTVT